MNVIIIMRKRIFSIFALAILLSGTFTAHATKDFRDYYESCTVKASGTINGIGLNVEISGSKNNCVASPSNTCSASGCQSGTLTNIVKGLSGDWG